MIYLTIPDSVGLISMSAHYLSVQNAINPSHCKRTNGNASMFFEKNSVPHLDTASHFHMLCKFIIDVYLLKNLVGNIFLYENREASPFVYLQSVLLRFARIKMIRHNSNYIL